MKNHLKFYRQIKTLDYDAAREVLSIDFRSGNTQNYCKVPDNIYQELESSPDQNRYYDKKIYGNYPIGRLENKLKEIAAIIAIIIPPFMNEPGNSLSSPSFGILAVEATPSDRFVYLSSTVALIIMLTRYIPI